MDIKSKNTDAPKQHNKFLSFLLSRKTRIIAFVVACVLTCGIFVVQKEVISVYNSPFTSVSNEKEYIDSYDYQNSRLNFYEGLCITSSFYLRNLDDKGNFKLSNSAFIDFVQKMQEDYGIDIKKDKDGNFYAESDDWDFYVAFGKHHLTNIDGFDIDKSQLFDKQYDLKKQYKYYNLRIGNSIVTNQKTDPDIAYVEYGSYLSAVEGYGEEGEYVVDSEDYSEKSLPVGRSGYDNLGRFFYQYWGDGEISFFDPSRKSKAFEDLADYDIIEYNFDLTDFNSTDNSYTIKTYNNRAFKGYKIKYYSDNDISLFFSPKQNLINKNVGLSANNTTTHKALFVGYFISWILLVLGCVYLCVVCGYDAHSQYKWRKTILFGRWYTDVLILLLLECFGIGILLYDFTFNQDNDLNSFLNTYITSNNVAKIIISTILFLISFMLCAGFGLAIIGKFKTKSFIKDSLIYRSLNRFTTFLKKHIIDTKLFKLYNQKTVGQKLYTITWIFVAVSLQMFVLLFLNSVVQSDAFLSFSVLLFVVYLVYVVWFLINLIKGFVDINKLSKQIEQISKNEPVVNNINKLSLVYTDSERLCNVSQNINDTVEKQVQSERMKVELITNVSHDLKTPLTSIIGYIDLLKTEDLSESAMDYVKILDNKSQKLKNIVSDVFSLAKATSGIDVEKEEIDGVILLRQVLADNNDKIEKSMKTIVTDISCDEVIITADGNKLYRVFQNLVDNALNYSLDGTRIFINLKRTDEKMILTIKNTASYEMNFTPEEITERFIRGDKSRTDGGSGLGLSIAKTFTEACGGSFNIELDGDVFNATVKMPLTIQNE